MRQTIRNELFRILAFGLILYWIGGYLLPKGWLSAIISGTLLVFGAIVFLSWLPDAYQSVRGRRGKVRGEHYALLGVTLLSAGFMYAGVFGLAWSFNGQPAEWLGTLYSNFGRLLQAGGLLMLAFSPGVPRDANGPWKWFHLAFGAIGVAIVAFMLGTQWAGDDRDEAFAPHIYGQSYPRCPIDRPVKGNKTDRGKIYHEPSSIDYHRTIAERCFVDVASARGAGYRPPG